MTALVEFLRARLDEDERVARAAMDEYGLTPCPTLWWLVQPYADHPDFDPAWRA